MQSSVNLHGALEALEVPLISRIPFPVVRLVEQQIPHAVERVDLKLHVVHGIAVWVDEDLEIRIRSAITESRFVSVPQHSGSSISAAT